MADVAIHGIWFCAAWNALAQGTAWLSPIETNGIAITNLTMVINIAMGLSLLVMGILGGRMAHILTEKRLALTAGVAATLASLVLLLIGPAYFQQALNEASHMVFQICAVVLGLSFALLYLRFGMLYARLPLRRAVLYLCYANLLGIFSYLAVQASPMWAPLPKSPPMAFRSFLSCCRFLPARRSALTQMPILGPSASSKNGQPPPLS